MATKGIKIPVSLDTKAMRSSVKALQTSSNAAINNIKNNLKSLKRAQDDLMRSGSGFGKGSPLSPVKSAAIAGGVAGIASAITSQLLPALKNLAMFAIRAATAQEDLTLKFKPLLGSLSNARARMAELNKFAATTPFKLEEVANASRILETLTGGALSTGKALRMVGDSAAVAGGGLENLAMWVGRAYSGLQSNRPIGEAMMRMQELGIVSGVTRNEIERLQKQGKGKEAWIVLQKELQKTEGAMKDLSSTTTGLKSTLDDNITQAFAQGVTPALESFKVAMKSAIDMIQRWIKSGDLIDVGEFLGNIASVAIFVGQTFFNMATFVARNIKNFLIDPIVIWMEAMTDASIVAKKMLTLDFSGAWSHATASVKELGSSVKEIFTDTGVGFQNWVDDSARATDDLASSMLNVAVTAERMRRELANPPKEVKRITNISSSAKVAKKDSKLKESEDDLRAIIMIRNEILISQGETELARIRLQNEIEVDEARIKFEKILAEKEKFGVTEQEIERAQKAELAKIKQRETDFIKKQKEKETALSVARDKEQQRATRKKFKDNMLIAESSANAIFDTFRALGAKNKALAISEAIVNTALAVTKTFAQFGYPLGIAPALAQGAAGALQVATISKQNFQSGGFPTGRNAQITVNENGQESILNANATSRLGRRGIDALNNGANPSQIFGGGQGGSTQNVEVYFSPVQTFNGGSSGDIIGALEDQREEFADFITESIQKGVLNV